MNCTLSFITILAIYLSCVGVAYSILHMLYFKSYLLKVQLFKMFTSLMFVFTVSSLTFATVDAENILRSPRDQEVNYCLLPPHPEHGSYTVSNYHSATPGERCSSVKLDISCDTGYLLNNNTIKNILCVNGYWSASMPTCVRDMLGFCTVSTDDLRVEYRCLSFPGTLERSWECESLVSSKTLVRPICRFPGYFSLRELPEMHCRDGKWDYNPICKPACGLTSQHRQLEGESSNHLELSWHAVIYEKWSENYEQRCSGTLIAANKIISAAYCFYDTNGEVGPLNNFVVAVNKMYRPYNDPRDRNSQHSGVSAIKISSRYRGRATYYEDNIAIVVVEKPFIFHLSVRPVCLDFDNDLDRTQLTEGNLGKTDQWSIIGNNSQLSEVLNVVNISYTNNEDCENILPTNLRHFLTKDKFCARHNNVTSFSRGNLGSGLAFLESTTKRYYLRGLLSVYLIFADESTIITAYTSIVKHEHFIKEHL